MLANVLLIIMTTSLLALMFNVIRYCHYKILSIKYYCVDDIKDYIKYSLLSLIMSSLMLFSSSNISSLSNLSSLLLLFLSMLYVIKTTSNRQSNDWH